ncbi:LCP family protein [Bacillus marinisedimentorum]|uniref:LCP family protein n=1 Tax=Bacillus marinisedimentorum TaxID=1821260 RepID=UPI0007DFC4E3|nr:LCP family protein [Bacillus marinisedimentorum]
MGTKRTRRKLQRNKKFKRAFIIISIPLLSVVTYLSYITYQAFTTANTSYAELDRGEKSELRQNEVKVSTTPISVLLTGVENYSSNMGPGRTDTIVVVTFNPSEKTIKLLSIPRDTLVNISSYGEDKINHAHAFGGQDLTISTIEDFLDIPIDYYASVNFKGFTSIIDVLGGVNVNVPFDFWEKRYGTTEKIYFTEGAMHLNGEEALAYARMRKRDPRGDFGRSERQREIITSVIQKATVPSSLFKIENIREVIAKNLKTNFKVSEGIALAKSYPDFDTSQIEEIKLNGHDNYIDNVYYFVANEDSIDKVQSELKQHLELEE